MSDIVHDLVRVRLASGEVVNVRLIEFAVHTKSVLWVFNKDGTPEEIGGFSGGGFHRRVARSHIVDTVRD